MPSLKQWLGDQPTLIACIAVLWIVFCKDIKYNTVLQHTLSVGQMPSSSLKQWLGDQPTLIACIAALYRVLILLNIITKDTQLVKYAFS